MATKKKKAPVSTRTTMIRVPLSFAAWVQRQARRQGLHGPQFLRAAMEGQYRWPGKRAA